MENQAEKFNFRVIHIGVNCGDAEKTKQTADLFTKMFGFSQSDTPVSIFSSDGIELMKSAGRGKNGHIAVGTSDILGAKKYLEGLGFEFDESSAALDKDGNLYLIYIKGDFMGFAVHLINR